MSLSAGRITPRTMSDREWITYAAAQKAMPRRDVRTFTPVWGGFSVDPVGDVSYIDLGGMVVMWFQATGTSNATTFTFTGIPEAIRPIADSSVVTYGFNNSAPTVIVANVLTSGGVAFSAANSAASPDLEFDVAAWSNVNAKGWLGVIMYPK